MLNKWLKKIRVLFALLFFLLTTLIFIDFSNLLAASLIHNISYMQLVPSLIKLISVPDVWVFGGIVVLIITLLIGRFYCSAICPLGIMQDILLYLKKKTGKKKKYKFKKANNILRYSILGITLIFILFGSIFFLSLLDPYSLFGKINANLVRPAIIGMNNLLAGIFIPFDVYFFHKYEITSYSVFSGVYSLLMLILIFVLTLTRGRLYCNTICPVGSFLGLLSKLSVFKIKINTKTCTSCRLCEINCKAECIHIKDQSVDFSRCVSCYNCLDVCPESAINLSAYKVPSTKSNDSSKRKFLRDSAKLSLAAFGLSRLAQAQTTVKPAQQTSIKENKTSPVSPPGSDSIASFNEKCTACHLCVSNCPTQVLQPSLLDYGIGGLMQPKMDYHAGFCNFECTICTDICPNGALLPLELEKKKLSQLGIAKFIKESCVVYTDETDCGACSEHCPTKAVDMVPYKNGLVIPEVDESICIGCGACEFACPTRPYRAIYVDGNPTHLAAKKPVAKKLKEVDPEEDFPF